MSADRDPYRDDVHHDDFDLSTNPMLGPMLLAAAIALIVLAFVYQ